MGAFDGARTHDLHITSQTCNPLLQALSILIACYSRTLIFKSNLFSIVDLTQREVIVINIVDIIYLGYLLFLTNKLELKQILFIIVNYVSLSIIMCLYIS